MKFGIYEVDEYPEQNGGKWGGYKISAAASVGRQGKLYLKSDGREFYQAKPKDETTTSEDLEI